MPFEFDLIIRVVVFLINFFGIWLIAWVYFSPQEKKLKKWFAALVFSSLVWTDFAYLARIAGPDHLDWSLIFTKITWSAVPLFFINFYFFISFLLKKKKSRVLNFIILAIGLSCWFFAVFTDLVVKRVTFNDGLYLYLLGEGKIPFLSAVFFYMILGLALLLKAYFRISEERKAQIQYLILGVSILYIMNSIFNVFLPIVRGLTQYYQFGDYSNFIFLSFTAYAIVRRKLFGMRVVITTIVVGLISAFLVMDILLFSDDLLMRLWKTLILVIFIYFGYLLVKSVLTEIKNRQEIERLSNAKSEFISIASHQLRTPLTAIKGYISMILEGSYGGVPDRSKEPMKKVYESNERLIGLVNNLLSLSRIESGRMEIHLEELSIEDIISKVLDIFTIEARNKGLYLKFKKPKKALPKLSLDSEKIIDVISNVVNNCIKYTPKGGITIELEKVKNKFNKIRIKVSDTGEGMTKTELSKMFESFSRGIAGEKLSPEGAGLGLYIARKYVEMHDGRIWAESEGKGKGSTFYIELPIK